MGLFVRVTFVHENRSESDGIRLTGICKVTHTAQVKRPSFLRYITRIIKSSSSDVSL